MQKLRKKARGPHPNMKSSNEKIVCHNPGCGRTFTEQIRLNVLNKDNKSSTYDACPYCFSPIEELEEENQEQGTTIDITPTKIDLPSRPKSRKPADCPHFLGYLSSRPKKADIPDGCLLCHDVTKCMLQT
jgi:hypothetical protein